jgi:hypothetical protein
MSVGGVLRSGLGVGVTVAGVAVAVEVIAGGKVGTLTGFLISGT